MWKHFLLLLSLSEFISGQISDLESAENSLQVKLAAGIEGVQKQIDT